MKNTTLQLIENLHIQLKQLDEQETDLLAMTQKALIPINQCLIELKMIIESTLIHSIHDEIWFFKMAKPSVVSKKIYFTKLQEISTHRPQVDKRELAAYLQQQINLLNHFDSDNTDFCRYINSNLVCLDDKYFVRGNREMHLCIDEKWRDPQPEPFFATSHDYLLAMHFANIEIKKHLQTEIERCLEN